jgi:hypothetical protein
MSSTNNSATLTNLAPNTLYTVTVKEVGINGLTTNASTTFTTTPGVVSNIKFAITNGAGTITWTLPTGGGNVKVTATPAATITTSAAADNVTATVSGLVSGTTYTFNFVITGGAGAARPGATVTQTFYAANAPTAVTATLSAANQAVLKFTTTAALTKFGANYATSAAGPWLPLTATTTIAGGVTGTMTVTAPTNFVSGTTYYFQVVALNASNVAGTPSASATIAMTTPSAVTGLTATQGAAGSRAISLAWTKASNNAATLTIFRRVGTTTGTFTQVAQIAGNATTYTDTGLTAGTTYQYYVVAGSVAGNSALSSYASAAAR